MIENKLAIKGGIGTAVIVGLLLVILLTMSFSDLDYYEMGFLKNRATGSVDTDEVYFGGRHFTGVTETFKRFNADLHAEQYALSIYNKEKIEVTLTCSLQYLLRPEDLKDLHDTYDLAYKPVLRATALAAIKGAANQFTVDEYRLDRLKVAAGLKAAAAKALGGTCCRKDCKKHECENCLAYSNCTKEDKGLFASLRYFQLQLVSITPEQEKRFLTQVLEQEKKDTENFIQKETITRKKTEQDRIAIENLAHEIAQNAVANSTLIKSKAMVKSKALIEDARNQGLQIIYSTLNITNEENKKSMDYIRTLRDSTTASIYVGFQYMVANKP